MINNNFNIIGEKNNQTSVSDADREIPTLGSTDNAGNSVNLVSGIISLPSGWDRRPMLDCLNVIMSQLAEKEGKTVVAELRRLNFIV